MRPLARPLAGAPNSRERCPPHPPRARTACPPHAHTARPFARARMCLPASATRASRRCRPPRSMTPHCSPICGDTPRSDPRAAPTLCGRDLVYRWGRLEGTGRSGRPLSSPDDPSVTMLGLSSGAERPLAHAHATCQVVPCEPWDFGIGSVHGVSGLVKPRETINSGETGVGECGDACVLCGGGPSPERKKHQASRPTHLWGGSECGPAATEFRVRSIWVALARSAVGIRPTLAELDQTLTFCSANFRRISTKLGLCPTIFGCTRQHRG